MLHEITQKKCNKNTFLTKSEKNSVEHYFVSEGCSISAGPPIYLTTHISDKSFNGLSIIWELFTIDNIPTRL